MINIRSITYNMPRDYSGEDFDKIKKSSDLWNDYKYFIRTKRLSLPIYQDILSKAQLDNINSFCSDCEIRWFNVPIDPSLIKNKNPFGYAYDILKKYNRAFVNIICADNGILYTTNVDKAINLVKNVSNLSDNGKDNFRLGLSFNTSANCPFFPFAHSSGNFSFSIALELTQEINVIIQENKGSDLLKVRNIIIDKLDGYIADIYEKAQKIAKETAICFAGFDFSLAPIIEENGSVISILRQLGIEDFSGNGVMFITSYLTNILKYFAGKYPSVGFSGVMYSLLEDVELCRINNAKGVSLENLIRLSTMCGCGIDMVPIKENADNREIKSAIFDVYGISTRLNKPLGVRFLPIPKTKNGKKAYTFFNADSDFISNTVVLDISVNKISDKYLDCFYYVNN